MILRIRLTQRPISDLSGDTRHSIVQGHDSRLENKTSYLKLVRVDFINLNKGESKEFE